MALSANILLLVLLGATVLADNPTATIPDGVIIGTTFSATNSPASTATANAYLGIPFAQSPPQRFSSPEPATPWSTPLVAQQPAPGCMEQRSIGNTLPNLRPGGQHATDTNQSEDCLYLNVYAPQDASPTNLKKVMFWIYGGFLAYGNATERVMNGTSFAVHQDVVLVSANYRTNIYGFPNVPNPVPGEGNLGFLDQRLALQWVTANIKQFGGDSSQITVFGESAGGYSVKQLLAIPPSPRPFRAAIIESQGHLPSEAGTDNFLNVSRHFNCDDDIECLRRVPAQELTNYIDQTGFVFGPVMDNVTCVADVRDSIAAGTWADVPLLMGTNKDELSGVVYSRSNGGTLSPHDTVYGLLLPIYGEPKAKLYTDYIIAKLWFINNHHTVTLEDLSQDATDTGFTCVTSRIMDFLADHSYRVWRYRFSASVAPPGQSLPGEGAIHASEIPFVFGTYDDPSNATLVALSQYMHSVWAEFAKDPDAGASWGQLTNQTEILGDIGLNGNPGAQTLDTGKVDENCDGLFNISETLGLAW